MNKPKRIASFQPTPAQRKWIEDEKELTGNSHSTILKTLIQEKINNG